MTKKEAKEKIKRLKKTINYHRYLYHVLNKEEISSEALDSLKKELFDLEQKFPSLITKDSPTQRVEGKPQSQFRKIKHSSPMLSINDGFSLQDIQNWIGRNNNLLTKKEVREISFYCELKLDGLAIELTYKNKDLLTGSTRGNGMIGEDVTQNIRTIESIPLRLRNNQELISDLNKHGFFRAADFFQKGAKKIIVRGEAFINKESFARINQERKKENLVPYSNPRNLAAGSIRQLDAEVTAKRSLDFLAYDLVTDLGENTHEQKHKILKILGFKTDPYSFFCENIDLILKYFKKIERIRQKLSYDIDGIVININSNKMFKKLGVSGKAPRGVIAFKFPLKQSETKVLDIKVQVGRTGVLTPVAILKPVNIGGVVVSKATLHNNDEIKRLGIKIGDTVIVGRAGDVIPDIVKVLTKMRTGKERNFYMPKTCPVCKSPIISSGTKVAWYCPNPDCIAKKKRYLYYFVSKKAFDIAGLGPKIIDKLLENSLILDASNIFSLTRQDMLSLDGFKKKLAEKIIKSINKSKKIPLSRFIFALGIREVGEETSQDLADVCGNIENLKKASLDTLEHIRDIGPITAMFIYEWFRHPTNLKFLKDLKVAGVKIMRQNLSVDNKVLIGKTFIFTGALDSFARNQAKEKVRLLGGKISTSLSSKTNFLVVGKNPGSKLSKAKKLKQNGALIKILNERQFLSLL